MSDYQFELSPQGQYPQGYVPCYNCRTTIDKRVVSVSCSSGHDELAKHVHTADAPAATVEEPAAPSPPPPSIPSPPEPLELKAETHITNIDDMLAELDEKTEEKPKKGKKK